ncbi:unnamed protein product [Lactuca virosa]|uniref:Uncharacterized protein n=1 Tax=Lactuca virosa TaxID=75947 RepID=A0AAU9MZ63_9ASTR|nr:unnamed protein product [Lactuca virosa]
MKTHLSPKMSFSGQKEKLRLSFLSIEPTKNPLKIFVAAFLFPSSIAARNSSSEVLFSPNEQGGINIVIFALTCSHRSPQEQPFLLPVVAFVSYPFEQLEASMMFPQFTHCQPPPCCLPFPSI